ncbi:ras-domain-containing protein [Piedraia hortae CBS 480.64]|uniref:Ras-domain-containing protein n=1 Tax=Piedraia hortae CBS 480.64 TaxID=1314780 RepID=A0A6A7CCP9_9PEZI|nr:ras-domain-containing protein [Piedraia hortae CBS 480.64]
MYSDKMAGNESISITICGDGGCGKSSITLRLVKSEWNHGYDPTIEDSYVVTRAVDGVTYSLALTDTAGQEEYRSLWSGSSQDADAFLLVYDITNPYSLAALEPFANMIEAECEVRLRNGAFLPICIVAGNKCDLQSQRRVPARDGLEWAKQHGYGFMETSAREMVNVEETFALIVRRVRDSRRNPAQAMQPRPPAPVGSPFLAGHEKPALAADQDPPRQPKRPWYARLLCC